MDKALKQRLVGATVLIILTVIVLPMLLSGRSDTLHQGSREIEIPQKPEEVSISKRRFPVGIPDQPAAATDFPNEQDAASEVIENIEADNIETGNVELEGPAQVGLESDVSGEPTVDDRALADQPDVSLDGELQQDASLDDSGAEDLQTADSFNVDKSDTAPENESVVTTVVIGPNPNDVDLSLVEDGESDLSPRYLVQVASFSSEKRADTLAAELGGTGMKVEVDVVERNAGRLHRVRVGPYTDRADADAAVATIKTGRKSLSPRVMDLRPGDSAPVSTPSDPLVRWVVQVGSFSSPESAEAQVAELRLAGLPAFSEKVTSSGGSVYKVRVGPEVNRDKATELARKIKREQNLDGFVTTQE